MTSSNDHRYYLGVDIGNTKTQYALAKDDGEVLGVLYDQAGSHEVLGPDGAQQVLTAGIGKLMAAAGVPLERVRFIYYGAAGADTEEDFKLLREVYRKITPTIAFAFENDGYIALKSGTIDGVGMLITNGTSNTNFAMNAAGVLKRIGGLTIHTGDTLGAFNMAFFTCRAVIRGADGRDDPTVLSRIIPEAFGCREVEDIKNVPLIPENVQKVVEGLFQAAEMGDGKALEIVWMMVKEVLATVAEFHRSLFAPRERFKLVLDGSVFKQQYRPFMRMLELALHQRYACEVIVPQWDPVVGALFYAFEKDGVTLTPALAERITRTYLRKRNAA